MKIAYLGQPGSYNYAASKQYLKKGEHIGFPTFRLLFEELRADTVDLLVVPVENNHTGSFYENYDLLHEFAFPILAELYVPITHAVLAKPGTKIDEILVMYAHPQALAQCQKFFHKYPLIKAELTSDTAKAAKLVAQNSLNVVGAIGTAEAAEIHNLSILQTQIEDNKRSSTRFFVVGKKAVFKRVNKCSVVFMVAHTPGSLARAIDACARCGVNLTKIESRPIPGTLFEYLFYLDFEGTKRQIESTCDILKGLTKKLAVFGMYESAQILKKK